MKYRNPTYNIFGDVDVEIEHPVHGWIPFTASPNDREDYGRLIYETAKEFATPYSPPVYTPEEIRSMLPPLSARQFRLGMLSLGVTGAMITNAIATIPDPNEREIAQIEWEYATEFERNHNLVVKMSLAFGITPEALDSQWRASSQI